MADVRYYKKVRKLKMSEDFGAYEPVMEAVFPCNDGSLSMAPKHKSHLTEFNIKDIRVEDAVAERKDVVPLKKKAQN
jgi:hypothetical protein